MTRNYQLVYYVAQKCGNYRDTGVSKNNKKRRKGKKVTSIVIAIYYSREQ
jgi:hypothetical protein